MTPSRPAAKRLRCRNDGNGISILPVRSRSRHEKILDFISTDIMRDIDGSDSARVEPGSRVLNGEAGTEGNDGVATRWCIRCGGALHYWTSLFFPLICTARISFWTFS